MTFRRKLAELDVILVLLAVVALELVLNRLAVPVLRPRGGVIPEWHKDLDTIGLFVFHLATLLALGFGLLKTFELFGPMSPFPKLVRGLAFTTAPLFFGLAAWAAFFSPPPSLSFHLESCFTLLLLLLGMALAVRPGASAIKLGLVLLTVPFLLHYYGTFALRLFIGDARSSNLPDRMRDLGQWSVAVTAIAVSICFAPRPLSLALLRPAPFVIAGFVGMVLAMTMVRHQDVGLELASKGLGIDFGPGASMPVVVTFVLAGIATTWSLASMWMAASPQRRQLGCGLALICMGGYAFAWPLTLLTVIAGALVIVDAGSEPVAASPSSMAVAFRAYADLVASGSGGTVTHVQTASRIVGQHHDVSFDLRIVHTPAPLVELTFGSPPDAEPSLTLVSRPERLLGARGVAQPPSTAAPILRTGDHAFDLRFRVHDEAGLAERLLDEGLRARAAAVLDGWIAVWPGVALRYHVEPGRGGPLDHPLPLSELRMGRLGGAERLLRVIDLVAELAERALACPAVASAGSVDATDSADSVDSEESTDSTDRG